ncbi:MAG: GumC family protein [Terracidiphilus sp.]
MIFWPNRYQSTVRLMPPTADPGMMMAAAMGMSEGGNGLSAVAGDVLGLRTKGALFLSILRSQNVQDAIIRRFDLQKVYRDRYMYSTRRDLSKYTASDEDRKSGILTISVTDRSPERAAQIANTYVVEMNRVAAENDSGAAHQERVFLDQRLAEVKRDLNDASRQLADFSSKNLTLDVKGQDVATVEAGAQLQGRMIAAESELRGLQQNYSEDNPQVKSAEATVTELRRQLNTMGGNAGGTSGDQIYPSLRKLPLLGEQYTDLYREVTVQETIYELLTKQRELVKVEEARELPVLRVLDAADMPERHSSPKRATVIALSFVLSAGIGMLLVLLSAYWQALDPLDQKKQLASEIRSYASQIGASRAFHPFRKRD